MLRLWILTIRTDRSEDALCYASETEVGVKAELLAFIKAHWSLWDWDQTEEEIVEELAGYDDDKAIAAYFSMAVGEDYVMDEAELYP